MKKTIIFLFSLLVTLGAYADDGHMLWLNQRTTRIFTNVKLNGEESPTTSIARQELQQLWNGPEVVLTIDTAANLGDGFRIKAGDTPQIVASTDQGLLYGTYALLRHQALGMPVADTEERPAVGMRMLNHWDNLDGSVERGYAGKSIWKWEEIKDGKMSDSLHDRLTIYARANASIGINATVLNNVNASPRMLTNEYLQKVKVIADFLRPYGIRVYLSANFGSPKALKATKTADPKNKKVQQWWIAKAKEIYMLIPDFGGFLVKANSEGQPGPGDYKRTHAEGANMLAEALKPYGGQVIWRSFVYGANHKGEDRVMQAVSEFAHLDGQFAPNVMLQSKNGPLDFQPREPYAPIFDNIKKTPQMAELQITQEYLGQSIHLTYLAPMWKELFSFVDPAKLQGIAGVANTGDDANWCGHPFSQANWYAFGRLAWNPSLSSEEIAREWLIQTFHTQEAAFLDPVERIMMESREACVNYMMPLGLHHIFKFDHHYGPEPDGFKAEYPLEWCPVYYHQADAEGIGFDRTKATGTGATQQYRAPFAALYEDVKTCPEEYLLWFHHLPWNYRMKSGHTLWEEINNKYTAGVAQVEAWRYLWTSSTKQYIDPYLWQHVDQLLLEQLENAREWRKACLNYFGGFAKEQALIGMGRADKPEFDILPGAKNVPMAGSVEWNEMLDQIDRECDEETKEYEGMMGRCYTIWNLKKEKLEKKGILWRNPKELNPEIMFD